MRDDKFTILKGIAIILVVLSHAGACGWINRTIYIFHVPIFFFCAGYFFNTAYVNDEKTYVVHRIKGLYFPFVRWSVFFLLIHNLLFHIGFLNETYGNAAGGVTHPFTWHVFSQNLWNIIFNMSGYDPFLCGSYWFFRSLLLSSIAFLLLFKLIVKLDVKIREVQIGWIIFAFAMLLMTWKTLEGLKVPGVAQGGARELCGLLFMSMGFITNRYGVIDKLNKKTVAPLAAILVVSAVFFPSAMYLRPTFSQFVSLPLAAYSGFVICLYLSVLLEKNTRIIRRLLIVIGNNTLYVFGFHLVAFKLVGVFKILWYGLPWLVIGYHPYVLEPSNNIIWTLLYVTVGVALPILWIETYRAVKPRFSFSFCLLVKCMLKRGRRLLKISHLLLKRLLRYFKNVCFQVYDLVRKIIEASSVNDEQ